MTDQFARGPDDRKHQMFPVLTDLQIEAAHFTAGKSIFATGDRGVRSGWCSMARSKFCGGTASMTRSPS
jgi:hypothetical protein